MYTFTSMEDLKKVIEEAWDNRELLQEQRVVTAIDEVMSALDSGKLRCAEPDGNGGWSVNDWV